MDLCVSKFGGAALEDGAAVRRVADLVSAADGRRQVLVVSAHRGVTQQLAAACDAARAGRLDWDALRIRHRTILRQLELPGDLLDRHLSSLRSLLAHLAGEGRVDARQRDHVLSFGERMSARVVAAHLRAEGVEATAVDAYDLGLVHRPELGAPPAAQPRERDELRRRLLQHVGVPVVTGFVALDTAGDLTTLGRNGSDLTATWLAEALEAAEVILWKPVGGVCSADPGLVPEARTLAQLGWDDAAALALHGADVLHPAAGAPARRAGIPVRVRSALAPEDEGTLVHDVDVPDARTGVVALAHRPRVALLSRATGGEAREHAVRAELEQLGLALEQRGVQPLALYSDGSRVSLLLPDGAAVRAACGALAPADEVRGDLAALAPVGEGVDADPRVAGALTEAGASSGVLLPARPGSRARVLLVPREALAETARDLHARLLGEHAAVAT